MDWDHPSISQEHISYMLYIYIHIHIDLYVCVYVYIYIYLSTDKPGWRDDSPYFPIFDTGNSQLTEEKLTFPQWFFGPAHDGHPRLGLKPFGSWEGCGRLGVKSRTHAHSWWIYIVYIYIYIYMYISIYNIMCLTMILICFEAHYTIAYLFLW